MRKAIVWLFMCGFLIVGQSRAQDWRLARIEVGSDRLVGQQGTDWSHSELQLAASPWNAGFLAVTALVATSRPSAAPGAVVYTSRNGGRDWEGTLLPGLFGDPQLAFGRPGRLVFLGLGDRGLAAIRSEDNGSTWNAADRIAGMRCDQPRVGVDRGRSVFRGRIYVAVSGCAKENDISLNLFSSDDDGRSWQGPFRILDRAAERDSGTAVLSWSVPLVLSDGTVMVGYSTAPMRKPESALSGAVWLALSKDGGRTFASTPRVHQRAFLPVVSGQRREIPVPPLAVDGSSWHRDRLYLALVDDGIAAGKVFVKYSDDRGVHWSAPVLVDSGAAQHQGRQMLPSIVVNNAGVVGVQWLDIRHAAARGHEGSPEEPGYDAYFAASVDGGATFLPAVRASSHTSRRGIDDSGSWWLSSTGRDSVRTIEIMGPGDVVRGRDIADYVFVDADGAGVFHLFWPDRRSGGPARLYTATATLRSELHGDGSRSAALKQVTLRTEDFRIEYDSVRYDRANRTLTLPLRVRNYSEHTLHGPLKLTMSVRTMGAMFFGSLSPLEDQPAPTARTSDWTNVYSLDAHISKVCQLPPGDATGLFLVKLKRSPKKYVGHLLSFELRALMAVDDSEAGTLR